MTGHITQAKQTNKKIIQTPQNLVFTLWQTLHFKNPQNRKGGIQHSEVSQNLL